MNTLENLLARSVIIKGEKLKKMNTANRIGSLFMDILLYLKTVLNDIFGGLIYKSFVETNADLASTYPNAQPGWAVKVVEDGYIYQYDGATWNNTGLTAFPADVATQDDLAQLERDSTMFVYPSYLNVTSISANHPEYLQGSSLVIPANETISGGLYYGYLSYISTELLGKIVAIEIYVSQKLSTFPKWTRSGNNIPVLSEKEIETNDGYCYQTVLDLTSFTNAINCFCFISALTFNKTIETTFNIKKFGIYDPSGASDFLADKFPAIAASTEIAEEKASEALELSYYERYDFFRGDVIATSDKTAYLSNQILNIPQNAGWGGGSYYGITGASKLYGKKTIIKLFSSERLTKLPNWVNGGALIPILSNKETQQENGWLYETMLNMTAQTSGNLILQPTLHLDYSAATTWSIPDVGEYRRGTVKDLTVGNENEILSIKQALEIGVKTTIVTANSDINSSADFKGNNAIRDAINSITDASKSNLYIIKATGNFYASVPTDYQLSAGLGQYAFFWGKDYVSLDGGSPDNCFIRCELPDSLEDCQQYLPSFKKSDYGLYQPIFWNYQAEVSNIRVACRNIRYPLHIDGGTNDCKNYNQNIKNCTLTHEGKFGDAVGTIGGTASGFGMSSGQRLMFEECIFEAEPGLYVHDNKNFEEPSRITFKNCTVNNHKINIVGGIVIENLNSPVESVFEIENCRFNQDAWIATNESLYDETKLNADTFNYKLITDTNPMPLFPTYRTKGLRIKSKSTTYPSTVRVKIGSTAFNIIGFKDEVNLIVRNKYHRIQQYGYQYRDGGDGLQGELIGMANIAENTVNGKQLIKLGVRLGDCTQLNKNLIIEIDGSEYTVFFNKDYTSYSNVDIINEILETIGDVAEIDEYNVNGDWYPVFKGILYRKNTDTVAIESGMGVVFTDNGGCRIALSTDKKIDGIAMDNAVVGGELRIITRGRLNYQNYRYSIKRKTTIDYWNLPYGTKLGISETNPGYFDINSSNPVIEKVFNNSVKIIK
jgi:hypothetical protein